jgi:hypothetical protein
VSLKREVERSEGLLGGWNYLRKGLLLKGADMCVTGRGGVDGCKQGRGNNSQPLMITF